MFGSRTRVHESLRYHTQTRIHGGCLINVEHKVGILDEVYPEAERQAVDNEKE